MCGFAGISGFTLNFVGMLFSGGGVLLGAARVALGTDVPVVFCNDDDVAAKLHVLSGGVFDQVGCTVLHALL